MRTTLHNKLAALAILVSVFQIPAFTQAAVIVAEPFSYENGQLVGKNGGFEDLGQWSNAWYGGTGPTVQDQELKAQNTQTHRDFSGVVDGTTVYIGATLTMPSQDNSIFTVELNDPDNTGIGAYSVQGFGQRDGQRSLNGNKAGSSLPYGDPVRFVCRVELNYSGTQDRMTLWDDNIADGTFDLTESSGHTSQDTDDIFDGPLTTIGFQGQALGPTLTVEDLNVVTSFGQAASAYVPEPATGCLLALLGAVTFVRRGKRR